MLYADLIEFTKIVQLAQQTGYKVSHPGAIRSIPENPEPYPYDFTEAIKLTFQHKSANEKIHQTIQSQLKAII